jgi:hypothetical protein
MPGDLSDVYAKFREYLKQHYKANLLPTWAFLLKKLNKLRTVGISILGRDFGCHDVIRELPKISVVVGVAETLCTCNRKVLGSNRMFHDVPQSVWVNEK